MGQRENDRLEVVVKLRPWRAGSTSSPRLESSAEVVMDTAFSLKMHVHVVVDAATLKQRACCHSQIVYTEEVSLALSSRLTTSASSS